MTIVPENASAMQTQYSQDFLSKNLKKGWFGAMVWDHILALNLKTVKDLYDVMTEITGEHRKNIGDKSIREIQKFFSYHRISLNGGKVLSDSKQVVMSMTEMKN